MRLRLLDAVVIAAIGLLGLKTMGLLAPGGGGPDRTEFGRVLTHARSAYDVPDPEVTGTVTGKKSEEKSDGEKPVDMKGTASPLPPAMAEKSVSLEPGGGGVSTAERSLLESLTQRREDLEARQRELDLRESLLAAAERKLDARVGDLKALEGRVSEGERSRPDGELQTAKTLVTMYEAMKPKDAARVFDRLSQDVLVPLALQMNSRKMAEVLASMTPEAAQKLTVALANRGKQKRGDARTEAVATLPANELPAIEGGAPGAR